ncbi:Thivi_2564 family membrane protein [Chelatococcus sp. GCM10030263]|jgi:cytochrome b subunit of formate dehydrogenase|uniref:Thivi_2564 family membrane protein n=1 Tax=Chelatococcus sp. GCM10030263 TaxID=3273387 RepID=UPI0036171A3A
MAITVLTHAIVTILICGLVIWLVSFLPFDGRIKMIVRVVVVVLGLVSIVRSLDLLAISPAPSTRISE